MIMIIGQDLHQWDLCRAVVYTPDNGELINEIHFANPGDIRALVQKVAITDGRCTIEIPNILLQHGKPIFVWEVNSTERTRHTIAETVLHVKKRPKPSDYVYAETEVMSWRALESDIRVFMEDMYARMKSGDLKGDLASVFFSDDGNGNVTIGTKSADLEVSLTDYGNGNVMLEVL